jgi:hypothetical protein
LDRCVRVVLIVAALGASALPLPAQERLTGTRVSALPAVNCNSDEGFGYGVMAGVYGHGDGTRDPYRWAVEPLAFSTTGGHHTLRVFVDIPYLLPTLRLSVLTALDRELLLSALRDWQRDTLRCDARVTGFRTERVHLSAESSDREHGAPVSPAMSATGEKPACRAISDSGRCSRR